ncbi:hypothetical protein [Halostreptopolyspora alba]|uniref:Uncharacterized protein n=1 Tax=Halostreptopolyspora alba TaxID=2487137 RepID=A0A3N0E8T9_9ACTN|nr:hypothetical protein EFW17_13615 [Nocardiopsaceae bacterium YIM 96095]
MPAHVHCPGRPEDLPHPRVLWAHGALPTLVHAARGELTDEWHGYWLVEGTGVGFEDFGGNWWNLMPLPEGRAVLYGDDHEMSKTRAEGLDVVPESPDWLPLAHLRSIVEEPGYVYWFDGASWHRVPYPDDIDDDGLELTAGEYLTEDRAVLKAGQDLMGDLGGVVPIKVDIALQPEEAEGVRVARALLEAGTRRRLTRELLGELLEGLDRSLAYDEEDGEVPPPFDLDAAFDIARRAGFTPEAPPPFS